MLARLDDRVLFVGALAVVLASALLSVALIGAALALLAGMPDAL